MQVCAAAGSAVASTTARAAQVRQAPILGPSFVLGPVRNFRPGRKRSGTVASALARVKRGSVRKQTGPLRWSGPRGRLRGSGELLLRSAFRFGGLRFAHARGRSLRRTASPGFAFLEELQKRR